MWRVVVARPEDNGTLLSSELAVGPPPPPSSSHLHSHHPHSHPHHQQHHQQHQQQQQQQHQHQHHWSSPHHHPPPPPPPPPHHPPPHHPHHPHHPSYAVPPPPLPPTASQASGAHHQLHAYPGHEQQQQQQQQTSETNSQEQQQQQSVQLRGGSLKRPLSDSDCDDVFSEESGKEPCSSPGGDSCQHTSRKRRRGMIEKKRRDRINASLGELRRLVPAAARDPHSGKLEKAEILQLTVEHLRTLRNKGAELGYDSTKLAMDYHAVGWGECAAEVGRYLVAMEGFDERNPLRLRLLSHLQSFHREQQSLPPSAAAANQQQQPTSTAQNYEQGSTPSSSSSSSSSAATAGTSTTSIHLAAAAAAAAAAASTAPPPPPPPPPLAWPTAHQYPGTPQYPAHQYAHQQQHGKPYRPWGAELAY